MSCGNCKWYNGNDYCNYYRQHTEDTSSCHLDSSDSSGHNYEEDDSSSGCCYITTTVCDVLQHEDDCELMRILRNFRDKVLKNDLKYADILREYDSIGSAISEHISSDIEKYKLALQLYNTSLKPITELIKVGSYDLAIERYKDMVTVLKRRYHIAAS